jgi:hypothetical protein
VRELSDEPWQLNGTYTLIFDNSHSFAATSCNSQAPGDATISADSPVDHLLNPQWVR